jgi:phosphatidylserine decarboxylase
LFSLPQYVLPQHGLSRLMHHVTRCENPAWKNALIRSFVKLFDVNMKEAAELDPTAYPCFNAFFTRALKPDARPLSADPRALVCPADGAISQIGTVNGDRIIQAKSKTFSAIELLGGDAERAKPFQNGRFATIYLSPRDYHRLHMPLAGRLREMVHVPGRLFSVNAATANFVPGLFARNERVVALFDTEIGPMALVLVGAIFVASIETVWHGVVTPPTASDIRVWNYAEDPPDLAKGAELGRFNMGSTIIALFGADAVSWESDLMPGSAVRMGQILGRTR